MLNLDTIVSLSVRYGRDPRWVIAGGGNTSVKDSDVLSIKASGRSLGELTSNDLVAMDRSELSRIFAREYPQDQAKRESRALNDLMEARVANQGELRPSVETLMHDVFPQSLVVHTHPTLVNALTCSKAAGEQAGEIFGNDLLWIPDVNPGYILGTAVRDAVTRFIADHGRAPWLMLLQNHGLVVAGDRESEIRERHRSVIEMLRGALARRLPDYPQQIVPGNSPAPASDPAPPEFAEALAAALNATITESESGDETPSSQIYIAFESAGHYPLLFDDGKELRERLAEPFTPDHLVYGYRRPVVVERPCEIERAVGDFRDTFGKAPRVVVVPSVGAFGVAATKSVASAAAALCVDALLISRCAGAFGGYRFMPAGQIDFIESWEVERFRLKQTQSRG